MRLIDLVINCLKETIRNDDVNFNVESYLNGSLENNPEYSIEINNVLLSVNKAIARLCTMEKIPYKHIVLLANPDVESYDISEYGIKTIKSVFVMENDKPRFLGWMNFGKNKLFVGYGQQKDINVIYAPKVKAFTNNDIYTTTVVDGEEARIANEDDLDEVYGISDELCSYINYFAKSELYEDRDPDRCKRYLNYFEQFITEYKLEQTYPHQESIRPTYKIR